MVEINHKDRDHALLSASSAHRWLACPPSAVAAELYEDTGSDYAAEGTLAHEVAEAVARHELAGDKTGSDWDYMGDLMEREGVTQEMIDHAHAYADYIMEQIKSPDAVVLLERRVDFSEYVPDGFGTCDCIILQDDVLTVIDYKYGKGVAVSAADNPQLKLYALGALNDYGLAYDIYRVEMHIFQPRINNVSWDSLPIGELTTWAEKTVKPTAAKAAKGKGTYTAGKHCQFCPHAGKCRALAKLCTEYVKTHDMRVGVPVLAPHELAEALSMEPVISLWLRKVKAQALSTMLEGAEISGWKVVEGRPGNRKWTNEDDVAQVLLYAGFDEEDYTETKLKSPAAMDKAIGKKQAAELLGDLITREPGAPTIAPETDKRPAYSPADDFEVLER